MTRMKDSITQPIRLAAVALALGFAATAAQAQEINVYSSRHYDTDLALYQTFTDQTGIAVNLIEGSADELIEMPRFCSISIQSEVAWRWARRAFTAPAS